MPEKKTTVFSTYESYRLQLAELALMFFQQAKAFPGVYFQILQGENSKSQNGWPAWIAANRSYPDEEKELWDVYPSDCWASSETDLFEEALDTANTDIDTSYTSEYCGRYFSEAGNLKAARKELERLSDIRHEYFEGD